MFVNYGDVDFFESGRLVEKGDSNTEFRVLYCEPIYSWHVELYFFADCTVDISDSWIEREKVESFCGCTADTDPVWFALGCIDYYGAENFASPYDGFRFEQHVIQEKLKGYPISPENLNMEIINPSVA